MGDQDVDHGVEAGRGEAGGGEAGGGGAAFTYLDPIQVLKRAPSSLAWKFFQFRKYETKVDETRVAPQQEAAVPDWLACGRAVVSEGESSVVKT
jgi:hypothetical protein